MALSDELNSSIGRAVRHYRDEAGLSQTSLARRMQDHAHNWYQVTVARTEAGQRPLRLDEALSLAAILDVSMEDLYQQPSEVDEYDLLAAQLSAYERTLAELQYELDAAKKNEATVEARSLEARARYESAQQEYEQSVHDLGMAREELMRTQGMHERYHSEVSYLRYKLERLQANRDAEEAVRDLSPSELMDLTIKNVSGTRVTEYPDGHAVVEVLVGPEKKVAARSKPFESRKEALQAARAIRKTFTTRHEELTGVQLGETQEG